MGSAVVSCLSGRCGPGRKRGVEQVGDGGRLRPPGIGAELSCPPQQSSVRPGPTARTPVPGLLSSCPGLPLEPQVLASTQPWPPGQRQCCSLGLGHELPVTQLFCPVGHTEKIALQPEDMNVSSKPGQEEGAGNPGRRRPVSRPSRPFCHPPTHQQLPQLPPVTTLA